DVFASGLAAAIRRWGGYWHPSRRQVLGVLAVGSPAAAWLAWENRQLSEAGRTVHYKAGETFADVGWRKVGTVDVDVTIFGQSNGANTVLGSRLASSDQGAYAIDLPDRVVRVGMKRPWRVTAHVIPMHGNCNFGVGLKKAGVGFVIGGSVPDDGPSIVTAS